MNIQLFKKIFVLLIVSVISCIAIAQSEGLLNKLLAPGPLSAGHKDLEHSDCLKCHDSSQGVPNEKCLECHKDIKKFVDKKNGFHGLATDTCIVCHTEHKGRTSDTTIVDQKTFDHKKTGYALEGKHAKLKCTECHKEKRVKKDFRPTETRFLSVPMSERHAAHKCQACHEDYHKNKMSPKFHKGDCAACHSQTTWKIENFDHKVTGYELRGKHATTKCVDCHKQNPQNLAMGPKGYVYKGLKEDCLSCHKDFHHYRDLKSPKYGSLNNCIKCHNESDWKEIHNFNHNRDTRFILDGEHGQLKCNDCHQPEKGKLRLKSKFIIMKNEIRYHWNTLDKKTCNECHKNVHIGKFSAKMLEKKCSDCHTAEGWNLLPKENKHFDHAKTRFPLDGAHTKVNCNVCHTVNGKRVFTFNSFEQKFCIECHDNQHKTQFHTVFSQKACYECHTTENFIKQKSFDHNTTTFALKGAHQKVQCKDCHVNTDDMFVSKPPHVKHKYLFPEIKDKNCLACHTDYHAGQLGSTCTKCHTEKSWKDNTFDHNRDSQFKLVFKHADVKCNNCHKIEPGKFVTFEKKSYPVRHYAPISSNCLSCHKDHHNGSFGKACNQCHTEKGWKLTKDFHRNFTLHGVHYTLACSQCHKDDRRLAGMSQECQLCHQKDDIHRGTLPHCDECHTQQFWEVANFKHSLTNFPLRGVHRTLDCFQCHSNGIYTGIRSDCLGCHANDAASAAAPAPIHVMPNFSQCQNCHTQFTFK